MSILVVAAHPDDEILGCGGSMAKWAQAGVDVHILIMAEGSTSRDDQRNVETHKENLASLAAAAENAGKVVGAASVDLLGYPDNRMDSLDSLDIVKAVEKKIAICQPHTVLTHHCGDVNIDHKVIHDAVVTACRPQPNHGVQQLMAFEVNSSTEWQPPGSAPAFLPNWFEDISATLDIKIKALEAYQSEMRPWPHSRSIKSVKSLAEVRGSSVGCEAAEAFVLLRAINKENRAGPPPGS